MTPSETAELLGTIQAFDRRTVGEADIMAWHTTLADIDLEPARKAVLARFTAGKDWLMPSDIRTAVLGERRRMVAAIPAVVPPWQLADTPAEEQRWISNYRHAIADGLPEETARTRSNYLSGITDDPEPLAIEAGEQIERITKLAEIIATSKPAPRTRGPIQRYPAQWAGDKGITVLDPDGWREAGKDFRALCTEAEFDEYVLTSTVSPFERRTEPIPTPEQRAAIDEATKAAQVEVTKAKEADEGKKVRDMDTVLESHRSEERKAS